MTRRPTGAVLLALISAGFAILSVVSSVAAHGSVDSDVAAGFEYWADVYLAIAVIFLVMAFVFAVIRLSDMVEES
jgi:hypothetical protein